MAQHRRLKKSVPSTVAPVAKGLRLGVFLGALVLSAFVVRLLASSGDLWLDEILSVEIARSMTRALDAVTAPAARVDNNHVLNTGWLYLVGAHAHPLVQRLHSVIAGTASVAAAYSFAQRWGQSSALFAAALFGSSFVMINYGSEARGYALLVCFALLAVAAIDRALQQRSRATMVLFWAACILGTLAHVLFVEVFVAILAWCLWRVLENRQNRRALFPFVFQYHVVPLIFMIALYLVLHRHMQVLGANRSAVFDVISQTAAFLLGFPRDQVWSRVALLVAGSAFIIGVRTLRQRKDDSWVLFTMLCVGAPIIMMILTAPAFVLPRYFVLPASGLLLLIALVLGRHFDRRARSRVMSVLVITAITAANGRDIARLWRDGRGQYSRAIEEMAASTPGDVLRVGGDHEFRQRTVLQYYRTSLPHGMELEYVPTEHLREAPPDWVVMHSFDLEAVPATPAIVDEAGREYKLFRIYPTSPLSGWYW